MVEGGVGVDFFKGDEADVEDEPPLDTLFGAASVTGETLLNPLYLLVIQAEVSSLVSTGPSFSEFST